MNLERTLLEHKYRYYVLCEPVVLDAEFDRLEREYLAGLSAGAVPYQGHGVGFSHEHPFSFDIVFRLGEPKKKVVPVVTGTCDHCASNRHEVSCYEYTVDTPWTTGTKRISLCSSCRMSHTFRTVWTGRDIWR